MPISHIAMFTYLSVGSLLIMRSIHHPCARLSQDHAAVWRHFIGLLFALTCVGCQPASVAPSAPKSAVTEPPPPQATTDETAVPTASAHADAPSPAETAAPVPAVPVATTPTDDTPTNRLARETSPYLRMHAHNPVDWFPWGEEALQKARRENKLIFLSVGYSSCYWCHVMERESFLDKEIAQFLNDHFVCIKVDREERPDIDEIYMMAVQLLTRQGGWPMSVFLTPEGEPFFGGTYFPARDGDRQGAPGFLTIISRVHQLWSDKSESIRETAAKVTAALQSELRGTAAAASTELDASVIAATREALAKEFDPQFGGFGFDPFDAQRPKFPEASNLWFLLDQWERQPDESIETMVVTTLDQIYQGGIWDHLGGGFHRYSTDRSWTIPHFEKMLYDNGQLLSIYARAFHLTQRADYRRAVEETFRWLQREMRDAEGGYYSALDAESEHVEGKYYRWTADELRSTLAADWPLWEAAYGLSAPPNFEESFYVLRRPVSFESLATERKTTSDQLLAQLAPGRDRLLAIRDQRERPLTDHKILCSWNGLTIRGLADASFYLKDPQYAEAGAKAAEFVLSRLRNEQGRLLRTYTEGQSRLNGYLDDYAFLIDGLIGLHRATGDARWLQEADRLQQTQLEWFWDTEQAGFFFTASDHEKLIVRSRLWMDGAIPAGNSVAATNLLALSRALDRPQYRERAGQLLQQAQPTLQASPRLAPRLLTAWSEWLSK